MPCKVYLAGPAWRTDDWGRGWRAQIKAEVQSRYRGEIEWMDPIQRNEYTPGEDDPHQVVRDDKAMIDDSDAIFVGYQDILSIGTWREVEYAKDRIPIAIWIGMAPGYDPERDSLRESFSPWLIEAGLVSTDIIACLDYLRDGGS